MRGRLVKQSYAVRPNYYNLISFGSHRTQLSGFIEEAYYNAVGRYVCQLQRLTLKFCKWGGSSKGARDFIESEAVNFSRQNPGVVLYLKPRRHKTPVMVCEYLNGNSHWMNLRKMSAKEISWWIDFHRTRSGEPIKRFRRPIKTDWPSVQGPWNPFLNMPTKLNITELPNEERAVYKSEKKTASELLIDMYRQGKLEQFIISEHPSDEKKD